MGNNARRVMYLKPGSELAGHMQMLERFREVPLEVVAYGLSKLVDMEVVKVTVLLVVTAE